MKTNPKKLTQSKIKQRMKRILTDITIMEKLHKSGRVEESFANFQIMILKDEEKRLEDELERRSNKLLTHKPFKMLSKLMSKGEKR
jgi:hypothetical protein